MQQSLQQIDLSGNRAILTKAASKSISQLQLEISQSLMKHDLETGYTKAYSLDNQSALQTAEFLIYSSLTTIVHRPGTNFSYTNNWSYEPTMGNLPTPNTFYWT